MARAYTRPANASGYSAVVIVDMAAKAADARIRVLADGKFPTGRRR
jgi:hypothetical protein